MLRAPDARQRLTRAEAHLLSRGGDETLVKADLADVGHRGRPETDGALEHILAEGVLALLLGDGLATLGTVGAEELRVIARGSDAGDDGEHQ